VAFRDILVMEIIFSLLVFESVIFISRGVATGWTCSPHLPEGVPEIDADPLTLDGHCRGRKGR